MSQHEDLLEQAADLSSATSHISLQEAREALLTAQENLEGIPRHLVEAFCMNLSRVSLGQRLYSTDNDLVQQMWDRLLEAWRLIQARDEEITLRVTPTSLEYYESVVFQQDGRDNIAVRLYRDGIRSLVFKPTLSREELERFLKIFDPNDTEWQRDADLVDRLWMLGLDGITYGAVDGFEELVEETRGAALEEFGRGIELVTGTEITADSRWGQPEMVDVDLEEILELHEEVESILPPNPNTFWSLHAGGPGPVFEHLHELLRYIASVPSPPIGMSELDGLLERSLAEQLELDGEGMVDRIMASLSQTGAAGERFNEAWDRVAGLERFTKLLDREQPGSKRHVELGRLVKDLIDVDLDALVAQVVESETPSSALPLVELIQAQAEDPLELWTPVAYSLHLDVLEEILYTVGEDEIRGKSGRQFLDVLWAIDKAKVFRLVASATPTELLPTYRQHLLQRLEEPEPLVRVVASETLRRLNDPTTGIFVLNILRHAGKDDLSEPELNSLLRTLMALGGKRYVAYLVQCLGPLVTGEWGLLGKVGSARVGGLQVSRAHENPHGDKPVLLALARYGSEESWKVVRDVYRQAEPELKRHIGELREQWEGQPEGDPDSYDPPEPARTRPASRTVRGRARSTASQAAVDVREPKRRKKQEPPASRPSRLAGAAPRASHRDATATEDPWDANALWDEEDGGASSPDEEEPILDLLPDQEVEPAEEPVYNLPDNRSRSTRREVPPSRPRRPEYEQRRAEPAQEQPRPAERSRPARPSRSRSLWGGTDWRSSASVDEDESWDDPLSIDPDASLEQIVAPRVDSAAAELARRAEEHQRRGHASGPASRGRRDVIESTSVPNRPIRASRSRPAQEGSRRAPHAEQTPRSRSSRSNRVSPRPSRATRSTPSRPSASRASASRSSASRASASRPSASRPSASRSSGSRRASRRGAPPPAPRSRPARERHGDAVSQPEVAGRRVPSAPSASRPVRRGQDVSSRSQRSRDGRPIDHGFGGHPDERSRSERGRDERASSASRRSRGGARESPPPPPRSRPIRERRSPAVSQPQMGGAPMSRSERSKRPAKEDLDDLLRGYLDDSDS
ncbi:MAG: hypothetical protein CMH57_01210 [Myxococcales bacterium]|nr:hypothetical protein [Myxococcales bacterium]